MYQPCAKTLSDVDMAAGQVSCQPCSFGDSCKQPLDLRFALGPDALSRSCIGCLRAAPQSLTTSQDECESTWLIAVKQGPNYGELSL